jgi:hypothetical protein
MEIAPDGTPANALKAASFNDPVAVPERPSSTLMLFIEIDPDDCKVMACLIHHLKNFPTIQHTAE